MKTGLFFGSFNPIHIGHLIIANIMANHTDLDEVWFVPSPHNPHKKQSGLLHVFDRIDLVERAIEGNTALRLCDIETHLPVPSYTIDTLVALTEKHPSKTFSVIMGSDNLVNFEKWKKHEEIINYHDLYVYRRPGEVPDEKYKEHPKITWVDAPTMQISATYIRKCIKKGKSIKYLVPHEVENQISIKKYYMD